MLVCVKRKMGIYVCLYLNRDVESKVCCNGITEIYVFILFLFPYKAKCLYHCAYVMSTLCLQYLTHTRYNVTFQLEVRHSTESRCDAYDRHQQTCWNMFGLLIHRLCAVARGHSVKGQNCKDISWCDLHQRKLP